MRFIYFCCFLLPFVTTQQVSYEGVRILKVSTPDLEAAMLLKNTGVRFLEEPVIGKTAIVMANNDEIEKLSQLEYIIEVENLQKLIDEEKIPAEPEYFNSNHSMDWTSYHDLDDIYGYLDYLETTFSKIASTESIGQSTEDQEMRLLKICTSGECGMKPTMWIDSGIHAREWISLAVNTYMAREFVENSDHYKNILDKLDIYILPSLNPDGYAYSRTKDRMWRKTRSKYDNNRCVGTDANRNWDFHWDEPGGSSTDSCSDAYRGPKPFSEPEAKNVADFLSSNNKQIKFVNSLHAYGEMILFPWGYTKTEVDTYDKYMKIGTLGNKALEAVNGNKYALGSIISTIYKACGSTIDWDYGVAKIPYAFGMELGDSSFVPPPAQIIPIAKEILAFHVAVASELIAEFGQD